MNQLFRRSLRQVSFRRGTGENKFLYQEMRPEKRVNLIGGRLVVPSEKELKVSISELRKETSEILQPLLHEDRLSELKENKEIAQIMMVIRNLNYLLKVKGEVSPTAVIRRLQEILSVIKLVKVYDINGIIQGEPLTKCIEISLEYDLPFLSLQLCKSIINEGLQLQTSAVTALIKGCCKNSVDLKIMRDFIPLCLDQNVLLLKSDWEEIINASLSFSDWKTLEDITLLLRKYNVISEYELDKYFMMYTSNTGRWNDMITYYTYLLDNNKLTDEYVEIAKEGCRIALIFARTTNNWQESENILNTMEKNKLEISLENLDDVMYTIISCRNLRKALQFIHLYSGNHKISSEVYAATISIANSSDVAVWLLDQFEEKIKHSIDSTQLSSIYKSAIEVCCSAASNDGLSKAVSLLNRHPHIASREICYTIMETAAAQSNNAVVSQMITTLSSIGYIPTFETYNACLTSFLNDKNRNLEAFDYAFEILQESIKEENMITLIDKLAVSIGSHGSLNDVNYLLDIINSASKMKSDDLPRLLNRCMVGAAQSKRWLFVLDLIKFPYLKLNLDNLPSVLLAYASLGENGKCIDVFKKARLKGITHINNATLNVSNKGEIEAALSTVYSISAMSAVSLRRLDMAMDILNELRNYNLFPSNECVTHLLQHLCEIPSFAYLYKKRIKNEFPDKETIFSNICKVYQKTKLVHEM